MKHVSLLIIFTLMSFVMGCQEKSSKKSSSSQNAYCTQYPYTAGCNYGTTIGGTTGGTCVPNSPEYWNTPSCPGFCQSYPAHASCTTGTTVGTTIGGITTGSTTGIYTNPFTPYPSTGITPNWGVKYPPTGSPPAGSCSPAYAPSGISYTPYETRKATMTIAGGSWYNPATTPSTNYLNTSLILTTVEKARTLFETDSTLKVRFKVLPQPNVSKNDTQCFGRSPFGSIAGYTKLKFNLYLIGKKADGTTEEQSLGLIDSADGQGIGVNTCTPAIDLSSYTSMYPDGIFIKIGSVQSNQLGWPNDYDWNGFTNHKAFTVVRSAECWVLDVEVAADGTKTFD